MKQNYAFSQEPAAFRSNCRSYLVFQYVTVVLAVDCSLAFKKITINWPLKIPEYCKHDFTGRWMGPEFFPSGRSRMLPLKALSFRLWLIVVDPCFITRYNSFEKNLLLQSNIDFSTVD